MRGGSPLTSFSVKKNPQSKLRILYSRRDLNPHAHKAQDFKSCVSTNSTTRAEKTCLQSLMKHSLSERRDSNPRPRPWQGRALPAELLSRCCIKNIPLKRGANVIIFLIFLSNYLKIPEPSKCRNIFAVAPSFLKTYSLLTRPLLIISE